MHYLNKTSQLSWLLVFKEHRRTCHESSVSFMDIYNITLNPQKEIVSDKSRCDFLYNFHAYNRMSHFFSPILSIQHNFTDDRPDSHSIHFGLSNWCASVHLSTISQPSSSLLNGILKHFHWHADRCPLNGRSMLSKMD